MQVAPLWPNGKPPPVCYLLLRDVAAQANDEVAAKQISEMMRSMRTSRAAGGSGKADDGGGGLSDADSGEETDEEVVGASTQKLRRGVYPFATFSCRNKVRK